ncbi:FAD-dependent monooxygenase [Streptomyces sp. NPDC007205]|uniref:NAD(P)/FAD-dependent oxidoreductase n=1 Tax=Streptomyces sp. NPDC007205 TaxID=3154316 RepID=UPI0033CE7E7B
MDSAIVMGSGVAGILAAEVLSRHCGNVTMIERDRLDGSERDRPGVPQHRHVHILWPAGQNILESLFPGAMESLHGLGAPRISFPADARWLSTEGWLPRLPLTKVFTCSRSLLEATLRKRLTKVDVRDNTTVTDLLTDATGRVVGVRTRSGDQTQTMHADLVVDATGRSSKLSQWLAALGHTLPTETVVDAQMGHATQDFRIPQEYTPNFTAVALQHRPPHVRRCAYMFLQENGHWRCTLAGYGADYPPNTNEGFLEYARTLRDPTLHSLLTKATPVGRIAAFRQAANRHHHWEKMRTWPAGLVALGDSACAFNPVYGHGMSVSALCAQALERWLANGAASTAEFQRAAARAASGAWSIATWEDWRCRETTGARPTIKDRILLTYYVRVLTAATMDSTVCADLMNVMSLLKKPRALMRPDVVLRVMRKSRGGCCQVAGEADHPLPEAIHRTRDLPAHRPHEAGD